MEAAVAGTDGYTVHEDRLALRVGELRASAEEVWATSIALDQTAGDLGPGDITSALREVTEQWRDGLGEMNDKIDQAANNVESASANYVTAEAAAAENLRALADGEIGHQLVAAHVLAKQRLQGECRPGDWGSK